MLINEIEIGKEYKYDGSRCTVLGKHKNYIWVQWLDGQYGTVSPVHISPMPPVEVGRKKVILEAGYLFTQDITVPHNYNTHKGYLIRWSDNTVTFESC